MHSIKIENYEREFGPGTFPWFRSLGSEEASQLARLLRQKLGVPDLGRPAALPETILSRSRLLEGLSAEDSAFSLRSVFIDEGLLSTETVMLDWHWFDQIDEMKRSDLVRLFSDIWYPAADDMQIFDSGLTYVLSVLHFGDVYLLKLE